MWVLLLGARYRSVLLKIDMIPMLCPCELPEAHSVHRSRDSSLTLYQRFTGPWWLIPVPQRTPAADLSRAKEMSRRLAVKEELHE